jgi:hypothetical protein
VHHQCDPPSNRSTPSQQQDQGAVMAASGLFKVIELWSAPGADGDDAYAPSSLAILRLTQIEDQGITRLTHCPAVRWV